MNKSLYIKGRKYISARRAADITGYAGDYIGQLCRAGKLDCKMVGRSWFVTEESLLAHRENAVDSTQERILKIIKNNDVEIKRAIQEHIQPEKKSEAQVVSEEKRNGERNTKNFRIIGEKKRIYRKNRGIKKNS